MMGKMRNGASQRENKIILKDVEYGTKQIWSEGLSNWDLARDWI